MQTSSCRKKSTGVAATGGEVGASTCCRPWAPAPGQPGSGSVPDGRGEDPEGLPSCGVRDEGTTFGGGPDVGSTGSVLSLGPGLSLEAGWWSPPAGASAPEATGEREHGSHPNAAIEGNMLEVEESMKRQFEDPSISTAGASAEKITDEPGMEPREGVLATVPWMLTNLQNRSCN